MLPAKLEPVIKIQKYVTLAPSEFYAALKQDLGSGAGVKREKFEGKWLGFARIKGGTMDIYEVDGRIDQISIFFETPVQNRVTALALLGLSPFDKPPTREVPAFYAWDDSYEGIEEIRAFRQPGQGTAVRAVSIRP